LLSRAPASPTDIENLYDDRLMAALRIERLLATGLAQEHGGIISLTPKGELIARLFAVLRTAFSHRGVD
jgi:superfamily II helicase